MGAILSSLICDFWVCEGRVCAGAGSEKLRSQLLSCVDKNENDDERNAQLRVLRGGCYGCCNTSPNIVVRRHEVEDEHSVLPNTLLDRLSLTHQENEFVYGEVSGSTIDALVSAHVDHDKSVASLLRQEKKPMSVAERIERVRQLDEKKDD